MGKIFGVLLSGLSRPTPLSAYDARLSLKTFSEDIWTLGRPRLLSC